MCGLFKTTQGYSPLHILFDKALGKVKVLAQGNHTSKYALDIMYLIKSSADQLSF